MRSKVADLLEVVGFVAIVAGVALVSVPAALVVGGVGCVAASFAKGRDAS
jgi:hypothetical protein